MDSTNSCASMAAFFPQDFDLWAHAWVEVAHEWRATYDEIGAAVHDWSDGRVASCNVDETT